MIKNNTKPESIKLVDHSNIIHQQEEDTWIYKYRIMFFINYLF